MVPYRAIRNGILPRTSHFPPVWNPCRLWAGYEHGGLSTYQLAGGRTTVRPPDPWGQRVPAYNNGARSRPNCKQIRHTLSANPKGGLVRVVMCAQHYGFV